MIKNMAVSTGDKLIYDYNTPRGFTMIVHASDSITFKLINANDWDYVVLQPQSQETLLGQEQIQAEAYPFNELLIDAIRTNCEYSQSLFYMTWRENSDTPNCATRPWVCTYEVMDNTMRKTCIYMAESNKTEISSAGAVWR